MHKRYQDCGILEWNPVPFPIPSRTRIPSRYRFLRYTGWGLMHSLYCKAAISNMKGKGYPYRFFTHFNILIFSVRQITICINSEHCCTFYLLLLKNFANLGRIIHYYLKKNLKSSFCLNYRETCESTGVIGRRGGVKLRNDFGDITANGPHINTKLEYHW